MPVIETIKRAFLSYSTEDRACVDRIAADLRRNGVEVWVDFEGLVPGTPDWETSIRHAVDQSFSLLLVASPNSRQSRYVRSEVLLAQSKGLPIYAVWAAGEEWIDSIPLSLAHVQYQDLRGAAYDEGLKTLLRELKRRRMTLPKHFLYKDFYRRFADEKGLRLDGREWTYSVDNVDIGNKPIPAGFVMISRKPVFDFWKTSESCDAIAVKPSSYSTAKQLINEIYLEYLKDDYPFFTYGERWLLREESCSYSTCGERWCFRGGVSTIFPRLALHWSYILGDVRPESGRSGQMTEPPEAYGLADGTWWTISEDPPAHPVVFAAHDIKILLKIQSDIKSYIFAKRNCFVEVEPNQFLGHEYDIIFTYDNIISHRFGEDVVGKIFVQNGPTSELLTWLR